MFSGLFHIHRPDLIEENQKMITSKKLHDFEVVETFFSFFFLVTRSPLVWKLLHFNFHLFNPGCILWYYIQKSKMEPGYFNVVPVHWHSEGKHRSNLQTRIKFFQCLPPISDSLNIICERERLWDLDSTEQCWMKCHQATKPPGPLWTYIMPVWASM